MSQTKPVTFANRGFWGYDVAVGIFLKHLIDAAEMSPEAGTPWLAEAVSSWRLCAVLDYGLNLNADWSAEQQESLIAITENACTVLATRGSIPAEEIVSWPLIDDSRIHPRGAKEVSTTPIVELGRAIIALLCDTLPAAPTGEAWLFGTPEGRSTIRMANSWDGTW